MRIGNDIDLATLGLAQQDSQTSAASENEDTFLQLMMAQLKHQDPFQPMEGGEFLTQLAQFEMVAGVNSMQEGLSSLAGSMLSNQVLESAALVGKTVFSEADTAQLEAGGTIEGAVDVPDGASGVRLEIRNAAGELLRGINIDSSAGAGRRDFVWDGLDAAGQPMAAGSYRVTAAVDMDGTRMTGRVLLADQVRSVTLGGRGQPPSLNLAGGGQIGFAQVLEIR